MEGRAERSRSKGKQENAGENTDLDTAMFYFREEARN